VSVKNFTFVKPKTLVELLEIKKEEAGKALILAGGTNLLIYIRDGSIKRGTLLDITHLPELKGIHLKNGMVEIGAAETMSRLLSSKVLRETLPFIPEFLKNFANPLVRNTSTIGGNIADASPIADSAPPLLVMGAQVVAACVSGERTILLDDFFINPRETRLKPDEVLIRFRVPVRGEGKGHFIKLGLRHGTSCSVTSVAVWLVREGDVVKDIHIALGGVAPRPIRAPKTEALFRGKNLEPGIIETVAESVIGEINPITDVRGSAAYRREVSPKILARAIKVCAGLEN
jgi:carbon-monoxide dehydrogenase medium subunit